MTVDKSFHLETLFLKTLFFKIFFKSTVIFVIFVILPNIHLKYNVIKPSLGEFRCVQDYVKERGNVKAFLEIL